MKTQPSLWFYQFMTHLPGLRYRGKILATSAVGMLVSVLLMVGLGQPGTSPTQQATLLLLTLVSVGLTLLALNQLLRPVLLAAQALEAYLERGELPTIPDQCPGQGGRLMANVCQALTALDYAIEQLSDYDPITRLPNRAHFQRSLNDTLNRAADGQPVAVVALQVSDYDRLLGTFGQELGDKLMEHLARRLESMAPGHWHLGRLESGCLALVRNDALSPELLAAEVELGLQRLAIPVRHGKRSVTPTLRAGIALSPNDGEDAETLIQHAFTALLENPRENQSVAFFNQETRAALLERHLMEEELRKAVAAEHLCLHFQPVVDCNQQRVVGAEALLRWHHPEFGNIPSQQFIPVAEATGLMDTLGPWIIAQACRQLHRWHQAGHRDLSISVNLSAQQLRDFSLVDIIGEQLMTYDFPPGSLEVELSETVTLGDNPRIQHLLKALRTMGVGVTIDDFGTGQASMSQLRKLPLDKLKIDREFVKSMATPAICQSLISLSKGLGLTVVAEGVETAEELEMLRQRGCDQFQGYLLAQPMSGARFQAFLRRSDWQEQLNREAALSA